MQLLACLSQAYMAYYFCTGSSIEQVGIVSNLH